MISRMAQLGGGVFALLLLGTGAHPGPHMYNELGCARDHKNNRIMPMTDGPYKDSKNMSAQICYHMCKDGMPGFMYFGTQYSIECFCAAKDMSFDPDHDGCNEHCAGNPDEICGGNYAMTVYEVAKPKPMPKEGYYKDLGCAKDNDPSRIMKGPYVEDSMSAEICYGKCEEKMDEFDYFGTQYSNECFCAKDLPKHLSFDPDHDGCVSSCLGNPEELCGGTDAMTVYEVEPKMPSYFELGCAEDHDLHRIMSSGPHIQGKMSAEVCHGICKDDKYFGTQYTDECWCAKSDLPLSVSFFPEYDGCTATCPGDKKEACGGHYAMTVYQVDDAMHKDNKKYVELGCAFDTANRIMSMGPYQAHDMTTEKCYGTCEKKLPKFEYFGTQHGDECFCAEKLRDGASFFSEDDKCAFPCAGEPEEEPEKETCGGRWYMTVFKVVV